ncbi:MAG: PAS domain-containing sensor histidine kinase [Candidatus Thorarchaeota archaeon]
MKVIVEGISTGVPAVRRKSMLQAVVSGLLVLCISFLVALTVIFLATDSLVTVSDYIRLSSTAAMVGGACAILLVIDRRVKNEFPSVLLLLVMLVAISGADDPIQIAAGRSVFMLAVPIVLSGMITRPAVTFLAAAASGVILVVSALRAGIVPSLPTLVGFAGLAIIIWAWSYALELSAEYLRSSRDQYRLLTDNIQDVIVAVDLSGRVVFVSESVERLLGYRPEEVIGKDLVSFVVPESRAAALEAHQQLMSPVTSHLAPESVELEVLRADGSRRWVEVVRSLTISPSGELVGAVGVVREIEKRKNAEMQLQQALRLSDFYTDLMAHDISNVNQAMMISLELLRNRIGPDPSSQELLNAASSQLQQCIQLVDKVRLHASLRKLPKALRPLDISMSLSEAINVARNSFPDRNVHVHSAVPCGEFFVNADEFLFELLYNLLHNSIKYDSSREVIINVSAERHGNDSVTIVIDDRAGGMSDDIREWLSSDSADPVHPKKRLGLVLVRQIVKRYGGSLRAEDLEVDGKRGTSIRITFPLAPRP